ncbi:glucan -beta-glucosidase [Botrytis cinerea]
MVNVIRSVVLLSLVLHSSCMQFKIPEVEKVVTKVMNKFAPYVHNKGKHSDTAVISAKEDMSQIIPRATPYWYEQISHQGRSAWGDGVTDDTAAINAAISAGGRCGQGCSSTSTTPAVVYFPSGTYLISSSIIDYYFTQIIGNPNSLPTLKATPNFVGFGLIDANPYYSPVLNWGSTNVFLRQIRNIILDMTSIPAETTATGLHWPTSQATSLQNVVFQMSSAPGTQHTGLFCESGSAGLLVDVTFNGGLVGAAIGNQQFTMRNLQLACSGIGDGCSTALASTIVKKGIDISAGGSSAQNVGSVILIDSSITNTPIGIITAYTSNATPDTAGSLILENLVLNNVPKAVALSGGSTILAGTSGSTTIAGWGQGRQYVPSGHSDFQGTITPNSRPASLLSGNKYYTQSKPQYSGLSVSSFTSARTNGAVGDGTTDDTVALQRGINNAASAGNVFFIDAGTYKVTSTITIPPGSRIVGESYSTILSSGNFFNNINSPQPVVRVGTAGQTGHVEWSDCLVSTQGQQAGATLIEWNLANSGSTPSGMWDVHTRIGGFTGSNLQVAQCEKNPATATVNTNCIAAYMGMHITAGASGLYMENSWIWTADHDFDDQALRQLDIYAGRGLYIESTAGQIWLWGTGVEHFTLYQYQFANTKNIFAGFLQTETPYYQPQPLSPTPFSVVPSLNDPNFSTSCAGYAGNCAAAWACSNAGGPENCQTNIFSLEGTISNVNIYTLATVGTTNMITRNGQSQAVYSDNINVYPTLITLYKSG